MSATDTPSNGTISDPAALKRLAALEALKEVRSGMRLGLGTGSTAIELVRALGEMVAGGLDVVGVPTSERTAELARSLSIPLSTLDETPELDIAIDGADEIGPDLALVKGGGGALLREKITATATKRFVVIADATKMVDCLGRFPLPIEVVPFGLTVTLRQIREVAGALGLSGTLEMRAAAGGGHYVTDGGHFIVDAHFGRIPRPGDLGPALAAVPGVVEHGLFLGMADIAYVAGSTGVQIVRTSRARG